MVCRCQRKREALCLHGIYDGVDFAWFIKLRNFVYNANHLILELVSLAAPYSITPTCWMGHLFEDGVGVIPQPPNPPLALRTAKPSPRFLQQRRRHILFPQTCKPNYALHRIMQRYTNPIHARVQNTSDMFAYAQT